MRWLLLLSVLPFSFCGRAIGQGDSGAASAEGPFWTLGNERFTVDAPGFILPADGTRGIMVESTVDTAQGAWAGASILLKHTDFGPGEYRLVSSSDFAEMTVFNGPEEPVITVDAHFGLFGEDFAKHTFWQSRDPRDGDVVTVSVDGDGRYHYDARQVRLKNWFGLDPESAPVGAEKEMELGLVDLHVAEEPLGERPDIREYAERHSAGGE